MTDPPGTLAPEAAVATLRTLFAQSQDAIGVSNDMGIILTVNPACVKMFGYDSEDEIVGQSVLSMVAPSAREMIAELVRRRGSGEPWPGVFDTRGLRRDGSEMPMQLRTAPYHADGERHTITILRELGDASPEPHHAKRSDDFYRALFNVNTAVKLLIDPTTGRIVDANQAAADMYGWSLQELLSMRITDINMLTDEEVRDELNNARTGHRRYFRFRHRTATGELRHVEVHSGPVDLDGEQLLLSIIHDVTERDALEERLRVSQRLEMVGRLAGGIAHDFNNLITIMMSASDLLLRRSEPDSPLRPYLEDLAHTALRASDLTRGLLAFSRRQVIEPRPMRLESLVTRTTDLLRRTLGTEYTLVCEVSEDVPVVEADPGQIEQVIMNLVLNARDAMRQGGRLRIAVGAVVVTSGDARGVPAGRWAMLEVEDEGEGMDEETRRRAFEPFFTTKDASGSGLGLATVHGIVSQAGGHVTVDSEVGRGSLFRVYLPAAPAGTVVDDSGETELAEIGTAARILLVDDMDQVRMSIAHGLLHHGLLVEQASSAAEVLALDDDRLASFDAVVSDVVMPGQSGVTLARELARRVPALPVLLMSGELREHDPAEFPPGTGFLAKPFTTDALARAIRALLRERSSRPRDGSDVLS